MRKKFNEWFWRKFGGEIVDVWYYGLAAFTHSYIVLLLVNYFIFKNILIAGVSAALIEVYRTLLDRYIQVKNNFKEAAENGNNGCNVCDKNGKRKFGQLYVVMWAASALSVIVNTAINGINTDINGPELITGLIIMTTAFIVCERYFGSKAIKELNKYWNKKAPS